MARLTKKQIYAKHGIIYDGKHIISPIGPISELLKEGNDKTGKAVYTWSVCPGTADFMTTVNDVILQVKGSCACDCIGCYAKTGRYVTDTVEKSLIINTYLVNNHLEFVYRCISAQLEIIGRGEIRIHAAGDFNTEDPAAYAEMWKKLAQENMAFRFWTYTKVKRFETLFDGMKNANIVRSVIPNVGINYGTCEYIINAYYTLKALDIPVYICKCGFDKNQHCEKCGVCSGYKYVLFLEHSTAYKPEKDPLYPVLLDIVNNQ